MGNPTGLSPTAFEASEEAIAARMLQGDPEAFSWLYEQYFPRLYDLACRMLGDPDEAMDVAQETFLKFLEGRPRQPPRHFRAYLYAMVDR
jgi:DNA-directed RNA polymerase specialized sigma24 family protein